MTQDVELMTFRPSADAELRALLVLLNENEDAKPTEDGIEITLTHWTGEQERLEVPYGQIEYLRPCGALFLASVVLPAMRRKLEERTQASAA